MQQVVEGVYSEWVNNAQLDVRCVQSGTWCYRCRHPCRHLCICNGWCNVQSGTWCHRSRQMTSSMLLCETAGRMPRLMVDFNSMPLHPLHPCNVPTSVWHPLHPLHAAGSISTRWSRRTSRTRAASSARSVATPDQQPPTRKHPTRTQRLDPSERWPRGQPLPVLPRGDFAEISQGGQRATAA